MTDTTIELLDCEELVAASDELLWRQVTDHTWDAAAQVPATSAFGPKDIDRKKPSFSRSSIVTAQQSRDWHQENASSESRGVWACTTDEVAALDLRVIDDSNCPPAPGASTAPGHCYIDYRGVEKADERILRKLLLAKALERGPISTESN